MDTTFDGGAERLVATIFGNPAGAKNGAGEARYRAKSGLPITCKKWPKLTPMSNDYFDLHRTNQHGFSASNSFELTFATAPCKRSRICSKMPGISKTARF